MSAAPAVTQSAGPLKVVGRYALFDEIARGGMATVHVGRLLGPIGFSKTVAIKRLHPNLARDPDFVAMLLDEARIAARVQHPNVVAILDVIAEGGEVFLVMEYVHGESIAQLVKKLSVVDQRIPLPMAVHALRDALYGLHAAHEAKNEQGEPLGIVHRDVSPHNILVGVDGTARVLDFGIAKAVGRLQDTHTGQLKGKVSYMAPEQLLGHAAIDHRADIFAAGIVLWELLTGRRLFDADNSSQTMYRILEEPIPSLESLVPGIAAPLAEAVARATAKDPADRFQSALEFARELEAATTLSPPRLLGDWVREVGGAALVERRQRIQAIEATPFDASSAARTQEIHDGPGSLQSSLADGDVTTMPDVPPSADAHSPSRSRGDRRSRAMLIAAMSAVLLAAVVLSAAIRARNGSVVDSGRAAAPSAAIPRADPTDAVGADAIPAKAASNDVNAFPPGATPSALGASSALRSSTKVPLKKAAAAKPSTTRQAPRGPEDLFGRE